MPRSQNRVASTPYRLGVQAIGRALLDVRAPLEQSPPEVRMEWGPARLTAGVVADLAGEGMDLGVEAVEVVERDRLQGHRHLRAAELVRAVMADDHVLEPEQDL